MNERGIVKKKVLLILLGVFLLLPLITCTTLFWRIRNNNEYMELAQQGLTKGMRGDYDGAIEDFTEYLSMQQDYQIYLARATVRRGKCDFTGAIRDCERALVASPENSVAYALRGWLKAGRGEFAAGIEDCNTALRIDPESTFAYSLRGAVNGLMGNFDQGVHDCTIAIDIDPSYVQAYSMRAQINIMSGKLAAAVNDCDLMLEEDPSSIDGYLNRSIANNLRYAFDYALSDCNKALAVDPLNSLVYVMRAQVRASKGELNDALADCETALGLAEPSLAYGTRAQTRLLLGDCSGALADAEQALIAGPDNPDAFYVRAACQQALGNYPEAVAAADTAIEISYRSSDFNTATYRARMRLITNEPLEALEDCNAALALYPEYAFAHAIRGQVQRALGDEVAACADFQWVLDHPSDYESRTIAEKGLQAGEQGHHPPAPEKI